MSQKIAQDVLAIASEAHQQMQLNPAEGQKTIANGLTQIRQIQAGAQRKDLAEFCESATSYLESMARHGGYHSTFRGTLDALGRRVEYVRDDVNNA
jgi:S-adenosylmethionine:tRNA-ribosyltransferase-isomerase (queuine synthetase)